MAVPAVGPDTLLSSGSSCLATRPRTSGDAAGLYPALAAQTGISGCSTEPRRLGPRLPLPLPTLLLRISPLRRAGARREVSTAKPLVGEVVSQHAQVRAAVHATGIRTALRTVRTHLGRPLSALDGTDTGAKGPPAKGIICHAQGPPQHPHQLDRLHHVH